MVKTLSVIGLAVLLAVPAAAAAQFTSVVVPPRPERAEVRAAERLTPERADSVTRVRMSDMRSWVDSAAAALSTAPARPRLADDTLFRDTSIVAVQPAQQPVQRRMPQATREFREGAPAPATATPLPFVAVLGIVGFGAGLLLLRGRA